MCCVDNSSRSLMSRPVDRQEEHGSGKYVSKGVEDSEQGTGRDRQSDNSKSFFGLARSAQRNRDVATNYSFHIYHRDCAGIRRYRPTFSSSISERCSQESQSEKWTKRWEERTIDATAAPVVRHVELGRAADSVGGGGAVVDVPIIYIILCPMCLCRLRGGGEGGERGEGGRGGRHRRRRLPLPLNRA